MELEGHPTHDLVEELERRGGIAFRGGSDGPDPDLLETLERRAPGLAGRWLFLPDQVYATGMDEAPS